MRRLLVVQASAVADVEETVRHIARDSPQNAEAFQRRVVATFEDLRADPSRFRTLFEDVPRLRVVLHGRILKQPNHLFFFASTPRW